ncbi:HAD-IC family P-type ATPase [Patescibacteria group bacterium]|nr:HAD-IC family P-type ATPase [Patescibacteria group bacterium]
MPNENNGGAEQLIPWQAQSVEDVFDSFSVTKHGLSVAEVERRQREYGANTLPTKPPKSALRILFAQFASPLVFILLAAAAVSFFLNEWLDFSVITIAVLLNSILGFVEEYRADRSLQALKKYLPVQVKVRRDGSQQIIPAMDLVPGDVMLLSAGDKITADGRIIEEQVFEVKEAALTGESAPVKKQVDAIGRKAAIGDRKSMVFAGTIVNEGRAEVVVVSTGLDTEIGKIAKLVLSVEDDKTPLQKQLQSFARFIGIAVLILAVIVFFLGILRGMEVLEIFKIAVAITVSAIPEGLAVAITVILAIGMQRILKKKALVRRLIAAETLGSVQVICADKTGTLTTGEMQVVEVCIGKDVIKGAPKTEKEFEFLQALYYTSGVVIGEATGEADFSGSQTEIAIMKYLLPLRDDLVNGTKKLGRDLPFSSKNKFAARIIENDHGNTLYVVGAPDILVEKADISDKSKQQVLCDFNDMVGRGLRVLAVARRKDMANLDELDASQVSDLEILGFVGLSDPLRPESARTIQEAKDAGLRTVMITGDHPETALIIAQKAGLEASRRSMLTGLELDELTDDALQDRLESISVYARVSPRHKLRIVYAWQRKGYSVAMTGDGVNDAPALKAADIGIALGSGTEVAKETSDIVLLDNNFKTIIDAIREGRIIFDNLRKMIVYLLSDSFSEIILVLGALAFSLPIPILPAQILWINLITDGFPSLALTFEPGEKEIMQEPPRRKKEPILNSEMKVLILVIGLFTDLVLFGLYFYLLGLDIDIAEIRTFMFLALGIDSLLYIFAIRKFRSTIFRSHPFQNKFLVIGVILGFGLLAAPMVITPLKELFGFVNLHFFEWLILLGLGILELICIEVVKEIYNHKKTYSFRKKAV